MNANPSARRSQANVAPPLCLNPHGGRAGLARPWGRSLPLWLWVLLSALLSALAACSDSPPPAPVINVQPTDTSATVGSAATLSVAASGPDLAYQWQQSADAGSTWTHIAGATQASHTTAATTPADNGKRYRVIVSASGISVTSSAVTLSVTAVVVAPALTVQPAAQSASAPAAADFSVTASGTAPAYQWQRSSDGGITWAAIAGASAATFNTGSTDASMNGQQFRVVVSNSAGSVTSAAAVLSVSVTPVAAAFSAQPADQSVTAGSAAAFSVAAAGTPTPTLQWQRSTDNGATWSDIAAATDATYNTGLTTLAQNGERYRALASNSAGNATSNAALLSVNPAPQAPTITAQPTDQSVTEPAAASFVAAASGVPTPTWQWQLSTDNGASWANINGATAASYTTQATSLPDSGKRFRAVAGNASGNVNSNAALLTVSAAAPAPSGGGKLAAAFRHTCAIKSDVTLNCWGYNSSAQLGSGDRNSYWTPNPVAGLTGVTAVATGSNDTCAIHGGGNLSCWGNTSVLLPAAVAGYTGVQAVAVGATHKCFITSAGNVRCAGNNSAGQLGDGTGTSNPAPVLVIAAANGANIGNVVALAAGANHTCALITGGNVLCWGAVTQSNSAVPMPAVSTAVALAAGEGAPCVLLADGTVQCWAGAAAGTPPQTVAGLSGVTSLAIGSQHACAVLGDTRVKCWGTGLMGNGNVSETQPTPQFVGGLTGVRALAAGFQHTCALRNDRSMVCWGSNNEGQLGTGDTASRTTPSAVLGGASFAGP